MWKRLLVVVLLPLLALLGGCLNLGPTQRNEPLLTFEKIGALTVRFVVQNVKADAFYWDFGDGNTLTTKAPVAVHTYAQKGVYTVTVRTGNPNVPPYYPGPAPGGEYVVLETLVDLRGPIDNIQVKVRVLDPPYWYVPGSPRWPENHFPAACALMFECTYVVIRPAVSVSITWEVWDWSGQLVGAGTGSTWVWHEAREQFIVRGCPAVRGEYRVRCAILVNDMLVEDLRFSIWACGPSGCL